jgi:hypothetical protein
VGQISSLQQPDVKNVWKAVHPLQNGTSASSYLVPTSKVSESESIPRQHTEPPEDAPGADVSGAMCASSESSKILFPLYNCFPHELLHELLVCTMVAMHVLGTRVVSVYNGCYACDMHACDQVGACFSALTIIHA